MSLADEIQAKAKEIHSDGYSMSLGELANLYKDGELILHPEFQREFRWTLTQKSKLIESALLGIPLPPIFVVTEDNGRWDVIDGLQRLSTFFEFMGILKDSNGNAVNYSRLQKTKFLPSLENKIWEDENDPDNSFTIGQRIDIKRVKIGVTIITKDSDTDAKFELFQRLNTGGSVLTPQEVRNCLMIMINSEFFKFVEDLAKDEHFVSVLSLSDRQNEEKYDMELICRYLVGKNTPIENLRNLSDINEFLNDKIMDFAKGKTLNFNKEKKDFQKLFGILDTLDCHPFAKYNIAKDSFSGMFLISTFEAVAIGLGMHISEYSDNESELVCQKIKELWEKTDFSNISGTGKSAKTRMAQCIEIGNTLFAK